MYYNILTQYLFKQVHHHHISSAPTPSACFLFVDFGFNTIAAKPTTAILATTFLPNLSFTLRPIMPVVNGKPGACLVIA